MAYVGGGWRSGQAGDITGSASTATVSSLSPPGPAVRATLPITLTVNGTGFTASTVIYAAFNPLPTTFTSASVVSTTAFVKMRDDGGAGTISVGVRNPGQALSNTVNFSVT